MIRRPNLLAAIFVLAIAAPAFCADWTSRSNENAKVLIDVFSKYNPEFAGQLGVEGVDQNIVDLGQGFIERSKADTRAAIQELQSRLKTETDSAVRQDLEILIKTATDSIKGSELNQKYLIPYYDVTQTSFQGIRSLLDDQVPAERRAARSGAGARAPRHSRR